MTREEFDRMRRIARQIPAAERAVALAAMRGDDVGRQRAVRHLEALINQTTMRDFLA